MNYFACFLVALLFGVGASSAFAKNAASPKFSVEYNVVDDHGVSMPFDKYGRTIYSFWPVPDTVYADGFDVVPLMSSENELGMRWMNLDSVMVKTPSYVTSYVFEKGKTGFSLQNFVRGVKEDGTISLFFTAHEEKPVVMNLFVANEGSLPITISIPAGKINLAKGASDTIPPATKLWVTPKTGVGEVFDSLYVFFSVVFDKDAYRSGGKESYAMPSQAALDALDSLRFYQSVRRNEINLEKQLKQAVKILEDEGFVDIAALSFRLEFFPSSHKWLYSFVFDKDLDSTFYDDSWVDSLEIQSYENSFPRVYRNGACFNGWSVETRSLGGRLYKSSDFNMALLMNEDEHLDLVPLWNYGPECRSVTVRDNAEHGHFELLQVVSGDTVVRELKDSLRVPFSTRGIPFIVRAVPDSAFEVEGALGGKLYVREDTYLHSRFVPAPDPEPLKIVSSGLEVSGNAVRLRFETGEMNIFRKIGIRIVIAGENGTIVDSMLVDSVETTVFRGEWSYYPVPVGDFRVVARVFHDRGSGSFVDSFSVANELALDSGAWSMVSLADVNLQKLEWDDDQLFYHWDESYGGAEFWQYRRLRKEDKPAPVDGYWYSSLEGRPLELLSETSRKAAFTWKLDSLNSGWNLVSNPHGYYVDLNASAAGDSVEFWRWNSKTREYEMPKVLAPYEAVWARVERPVSWNLDGVPVFDTTLWKPLPRPVLTKMGPSDGWNFRMVLSDGKGKMDSWNVLGVASEERISYEPPEAMGNRVNLSVVQGKNYLARSILQESSSMEYEWTLEMDASGSRSGFISVEDADLLWKQGFRVFVTIDGETSELKGGDSLKVKLSASPKKFQVRVAKEAKKPASYSFDRLRVSQVSGSLVVEFDAGDGLSGKSSRLELLDMTGKRLKSKAFSAQNGLNVEKLDGLAPGLYIVRVLVGHRQLLSKVAIK